MNHICESRLSRRCAYDGWRNGRRTTAVSVSEGRVARVYFSGSCEWDGFDVYLSRCCNGTSSYDIGESRLDSK